MHPRTPNQSLLRSSGHEDGSENGLINDGWTQALSPHDRMRELSCAHACTERDKPAAAVTFKSRDCEFLRIDVLGHALHTNPNGSDAPRCLCRGFFLK